jgi:hypothetical protein
MSQVRRVCAPHILLFKFAVRARSTHSQHSLSANTAARKRVAAARVCATATQHDCSSADELVHVGMAASTATQVCLAQQTRCLHLKETQCVQLP